MLRSALPTPSPMRPVAWGACSMISTTSPCPASAGPPALESLDSLEVAREAVERFAAEADSRDQALSWIADGRRRRDAGGGP